MGESIRVGGQALPDGVMMRTDRAWAIARSDGTIETGELPRTPAANIPVVRVIVGLGPALLLGLRGGGSRRSRSGRRIPWPLLRGLALAQAAAVVANALIARARLGPGWTAPVAVAVVVVAIAVFRVATPSVQWRFHGAEHKAVAAHERGIDLAELDAVLMCSRVHPRCGTNLIFWLSLAAASMTRLALLPQLAATVVALAVIAEVMTAASHHPKSVIARVLQAPGQVLQWLITTSEPSRTEQEIGCHALRACLAHHSALTRVPVVA